MTKRKAHNSILFLTTLSVYLGLVLVGGSPSVLAHAALTQRLEFVSEFETEDDLDKKPEDGQIVGDIDARDELARLIEQFAEHKSERLSEASPVFDGSEFSIGFSSLIIGLEQSSAGFSFQSDFAPDFGPDAVNAFYHSIEARRKPASVVAADSNAAVIARFNPQLSVVTRRPRASIDEFPA